jgi:hypothetical protein
VSGARQISGKLAYEPSEVHRRVTDLETAFHRGLDASLRFRVASHFKAS